MALLLGLFLVQSISSMRLLSATHDETTYLASGYVFLRTGETRLNPEHPPLVKLLCALPLVALGPNLDLRDPAYTQDPPDQWAFGYRFLFNNDADGLLFWGRLPVVLLTAVLGIYVFLWARTLFGPGGGVALFLFAFSPNLIAHSHLATLDAPLATFSVAALFHLWRFSSRGGADHLVASGIFLGLALGSKHAATALFPVSAVLLGSIALFPGEGKKGADRVASAPRRIRRASLAFLGMAAIAVGLLCLIYGAPSDLLVYFQRLEPGNLYPEPNPDYEYYLAGKFSHAGWWYYFLVAFLLKTPVPTLILLALSTLLAITRGYRSTRWPDEAFLLVPALAFVVPASIASHDIGLRYLLPLYPLIFISIGRCARFFRRGRLRPFVAILLGAWYLIGAAWIYPDHLAYFNEIVGGPSRGHEYLDDSNIDWGQDLKRLKRWTEEHRVEKIRLMYPWNTSADYYGISWELVTNEDLLVQPRPGVYAMSTHLLIRARMWAHRDGVHSDWLDRYTPVDRVGYSFFIYRFE